MNLGRPKAVEDVRYIAEPGTKREMIAGTRI